MEERAEVGRRDRLVEVGVVKDHERGLASELEQDALEVASGLLGDDPAHPCGAGEVDAPDRRVGDQLVDHLRRVGRLVDDQVDHPGRKPASTSTRAIAAWTRGHSSDALSTTVLPYASGVATARATEDHRRVPRRDAPRPRPRARGCPSPARPARSEGITSPTAPVRLGAGLPQHPAASEHVEHAPAERAAGLGGHQAGDLLRPLLEQPRRRVEQRATPPGRAPRPVRERRRGCLDRAPQSSRPAAATDDDGSPSTGPELSQRRPESASTHSPPINSRCGSWTCTVAIAPSSSVDTSDYLTRTEPEGG